MNYRKRKADQTIENLEQPSCDFKQVLCDRLKSILNIENFEEIEANLDRFLVSNHFNSKTSSLVAVGPLKSQICNYLSYFPNFQVLYHSKSTDQDQTIARLMKFGLYPVLNPSMAFNETDEMSSVVEDILNKDESGKRMQSIN